MSLWYSVVLMIFSIGFVLLMNFFLTQYMTKTLPFEPVVPFRRNPIIRQISEDQRAIIAQSRLEDLENIRLITLYSIIPLVILSFAGGYAITERHLRPLENLSKEMQLRSTEDLGKEIEFEDNDDEISSVIKSFNQMSKRLSHAFNAQREFVENASHEIKTPLAIIQANLDTALEDNSLTDAELKQLLADSKKAIHFMNQLTEDLLLLSLMDANLKMKKIDISSILNTIRTEVKVVAKQKKFKVVLDCKKGVVVSGNTTLIHRAFQNIIENAIAHSGGDLVSIDCKEENGFAVISIRDNGKGIGASYSKRIFERFYRLDKSRSRQTGGSGLGLAIAKEIISKHGGNLELVTGVFDKGAHFIISIPIAV